MIKSISQHPERTDGQRAQQDEAHVLGESRDRRTIQTSHEIP